MDQKISPNMAERPGAADPPPGGMERDGAQAGARHEELHAALVWAYRLILDREPENDQVTIPAEDDTVKKIRERFFTSPEYANRLRAEETLGRLRAQWRREETPRRLIVQTADPVRYRDLLLAAARYNAVWAAERGWEYRLHLGDLFGPQPHHATYNRILLLNELVRSGFRGWALYLDADNLLLPGMDLTPELRAAEEEGVSMVFFNHRRPDEEGYSFTDINAGLAAFFIGDRTAGFLLEAWWKFYELTYPETFVQSVKKWGDIVNDQQSLEMLLGIFCDSAEFRKKIAMKYIHDYVKWFGRGTENPDAADVETRKLRLLRAGEELYGF